jgi:hypothetical protein
VESSHLLKVQVAEGLQQSALVEHPRVAPVNGTQFAGRVLGKASSHWENPVLALQMLPF